MRVWTAILLFAFTFCIAGVSFGQEVLDLQYKSSIESTEGGISKSQLFDQAVQALTLENVSSMIGAEKTERNRTLIDNKIIKNSQRYILSIRGDNYAKNGSTYAMDVAVKFSLKNLRALLLENGLLYQMEGPPKVLPAVQFVDRVNGRSFGWWYPNHTKNHGWLRERMISLHKGLREDLRKIGFFSFMPIENRTHRSLPEAFRGESLQKADYLFLGEYLKSSIVVRGQVLFRPHQTAENVYLIDVRLEAFHSGNGRLLGEIVRTYETDAGPFVPVITKAYTDAVPKITADLTSQLEEAWKKGTFGASLLQLAVSGRLSPKELNDFKQALILQVRDIKSLKERRIEARKTTYEMDSSALPQELAQTLKTHKFAKFKVEVDGVTASGLEISVEPL